MIHIRPYATKDSARLSQAIGQVCADTPWMATRSFIPTHPWVHALELDGCVFHKLLVAESDGNVVGWCRSFPATCGELLSRAELGIGLMAQYRNQGIGSELVMRSLDWAESADLRTVDLTVSLGNSIAIHVFGKCGFEAIKIEGSQMLMSVSLS